MIKLVHNNRAKEIPVWAVLERRLINSMNETPEVIMKKYVKENGYLLWPSDPNYTSTDALDDMYESFHNWPLFYLLGGDKKFLDYSHKEFNAITEQFTHYSCGHGHPIVVKGYEQGYDWMHQGEGYLFFYLLNLADPKNKQNIERSKQFAGFLLNEDEDAVNYDYDNKMLKCCYLGSKGAAHRNFDESPWLWADWKQWYGLPFNDIPGITTVQEMKDPEKALEMARVMKLRLAYSDTVVNLMSTTMVMNAYMHTGQEKYKSWVLDYIGAWRDRTEENGGIVPDNVGRNGKIGGEMNGKWYGGYYGWTWPHGFYFIADSLTIACENKALLTGDKDSAEWVRSQYNLMLERAIEKDGVLYIPQKKSEPGAVQEYNTGDRFLKRPDKTTDNKDFTRLLEVDGWYEFSPLPQTQPIHMWFMSRQQGDMDFICKTADKREQAEVKLNEFYSKYQGGQDIGWLSFLRGCFGDYPEKILQHNLKQSYTRMKEISEDTEPQENYTDSYLQKRNPITVEGLVHLTMGGPMPIYNGGLLNVSLIYFDAKEKRPGLPRDVAALISAINGDEITLTLCNLSNVNTGEIIIQAGAFGEHNFEAVSFEGQNYSVNDNYFELCLGAGCVTELSIKMDRYKNPPAYRWHFR